MNKAYIKSLLEEVKHYDAQSQISVHWEIAEPEKIRVIEYINELLKELDRCLPSNISIVLKSKFSKYLEIFDECEYHISDKILDELIGTDLSDENINNLLNADYYNTKNT